MLVSYKWLSEYVDLSEVTPEALADKLSRTGIEVEEVHPLDEGLKKIVVGHVEECVDHPNSDHLHICQVNIGEEVTQIVCGAPNVASGQNVIVALPGARIVDNIKIKKGKMRGEASNGMICALEEIGIPNAVTPKEYAEGIYILPDDATPGESVFPLLGMDDVMLDLAITPNRADALGMRGVAYEVAAVYHKDLKFQEVMLEETDLDNAMVPSVQDEALVPTYAVRYLKDVEIKESPLWMQLRLMHAGIRPINNIVDITNYILLEYGQPLHAYDAMTVKGNICVRAAHDGEEIVTLDGETLTLTTEDLVIADEEKVMSLAGVMGGESTSVTGQTVDIYLEAACFDPTSIRKTSQRHHLRTEASARFEKGINRGGVIEAMNAAASLMQRYANATIDRHVAYGSHEKVEPVVVTITLDRINQTLGTELSVNEVQDILEALRFDVNVIRDAVFDVTIPSRRWDIHIEADIIEEVGRLYGYDHLPMTLPKVEMTTGDINPERRFDRHMRRVLEGEGLQETINYALTTAEKSVDFVKETKDTVELAWPMSNDRAVMRQSLIPGLLETVQYNVARKQKDLAIYEIGKVFYKDVQPEEHRRLGLALTGMWQQANWQVSAKKADFYTAKALVEKLMAQLSLVDSIRYVSTGNMPSMHPGRTAEIYVGEQYIGFVGELHPEAVKRYDIPATIVAELDLEVMQQLDRQVLVAQSISKYPSVTRDIALLVDCAIDNAQIEQALTAKAGKYLVDVTLFDIYQGENVPTGKKSMAYQLTFQKMEDTLTDEEIEKTMEKITKNVEEVVNASVR